MSETAVTAAQKPIEERHGHSLLIVRLIAISKFIKASLLLIIGIFILHMLKLDQNAHDALHAFVNDLKLDENNHFIHGILENALGIQRNTLKTLSVGTMIYAVLYYIEGAGLFMDKGWAEWMTIITTAGLIPFEITEVIKQITVLRVGIFILNILILVYIAMRLRWRHLAKVHARQQGATLIIPRQTLPTGIKP